MKGDQVGQNKETRYPYTYYGRTVASFKDAEVDIFCYRGSLSTPGWIDEDPCNFLPQFRVLILTRSVSASFTKACTIRADLSEAARVSGVKTGSSGETFYKISYHVVAFFGSTEWTAQVAWETNVSHHS